MAHEPESTPPENAIDRQVPRIRYIFVLPIIALFIGSLALMVLGFFETFQVVVDAMSHGSSHAVEELKLHLVEIIDVFLLGTILYMIASGFYQLFLGRHVKVVPWMRVDSVHDLEVMLLGVVITLLAVTALAAVMSWDGQTDLMPLGVTVGLVIAALGFFLGRSGQH